MDCNMVSPLQWGDWENLIMSNPLKAENGERQLSSTRWEVEKGEGIESIVPCFASLGRVSSSFWHTAVSKSSQSTSINLASESSPGGSCSNVDFVQAKASTALEASVASAESDLCLQLGKKTYSDELWGRNCNNNISAVSVKLLTPSVVVTRKKSKSSCGQSLQAPRCQIDGCELDLSSAKSYHRKHRVCEIHSKCPKVIVGGLERRFCQQCSRLHAVSEFDGKKRSCRKRLSHHNARRRKPQGVFPLNKVYDRKQHPNMLWNGLSLNTKSEETYAWGTTFDTKPTQMESGFTLSFQRGHGSEKEQLFASSSRSFSSVQTSGGFLPAKFSFQLPYKGVGESCSGGLHESQDFHSALSLLSTSSDSRGSKHDPLIEAQPIFGTFPTPFI